MGVSRYPRPAAVEHVDQATFGHPAFDLFRQWLPGGRMPSLAELNAWAVVSAARSAGRPLQFVAGAALRALEYESRIAERGEIVMRPESLHDACNALAWLAFPRTKATLNALHVGDPPASNGRRSARRDAATLLDESGVLVACADPRLPSLLRDHAWHALFVTGREDVARSWRAVICGHGLLARMVTPFRAITGRALVVPVDPAGLPAEPSHPADWARVDSAAARFVASSAFTTAALLPLPIAALPGWDAEQLGDRLFDDVSVFRPRVLR